MAGERILDAWAAIALRGRLSTVLDAGRDLALAAARLKTAGGLSLADAFAAATAQIRDAVLLTGDPELLASDGAWRVEDLRHGDAGA